MVMRESAALVAFSACAALLVWRASRRERTKRRHAWRNVAIDGLECRLAVREDIPLIVGPLSEGIYKGADYLPVRIDFYFGHHETGEYSMIVCCDRLTGVILGLDCVCKYDIGETIMLQALRVREDARGKGVAKALSAGADALIRTLHNPRPQRVRIITTVNNPSVGLHTKQGFSETHRMGICGAEIRAGAGASTALGRAPAASHVEIRISEVPSAAEALRRLPPRGCPYLVFDWQVERVSLANVERLQKEHGVRFFSGWRGEGDGACGRGGASSLSLGALTSWVSGMQMYVTVYAGGDPVIFAAHATHWVREARHSGARAVVFFYDYELDGGNSTVAGGGLSSPYTAVADALGESRGDWVPFFFEATGVMVMEKALRH
jgi:GNAT superfamily N-acetyltransferase